jgi:hypothetical protein
MSIVYLFETISVPMLSFLLNVGDLPTCACLVCGLDPGGVGQHQLILFSIVIYILILYGVTGMTKRMITDVSTTAAEVWNIQHLHQEYHKADLSLRHDVSSNPCH